MAKKLIGIRLDEEMIKILKETSRKEEEGNVSKTIRRILRNYFLVKK